MASVCGGSKRIHLMVFVTRSRSHKSVAEPTADLKTAFWGVLPLFSGQVEIRFDI